MLNDFFYLHDATLGYIFFLLMPVSGIINPSVSHMGESPLYIVQLAFNFNLMAQLCVKGLLSEYFVHIFHLLWSKSKSSLRRAVPFVKPSFVCKYWIRSFFVREQVIE